MARATRAAAVLKQKLGIEPELRRGSGGIFEISVNEQVVAAKSLRGFPSEEELVAAVSRALGR